MDIILKIYRTNFDVETDMTSLDKDRKANSSYNFLPFGSMPLMCFASTTVTLR